MRSLPYWRLSGYYFFYFAFNGAFMPYFGLYLQSLKFSAWDIGLLMSLMQVMRLFGPSLWGWLADRGHRRVTIVRLAGLVSLLGFTGFFWLRDLNGMMLAMGLLAFFWSAALPLVETLTFNHLRGAAGRYSQIRLWGSVGFIIAVLGTGALLDRAPLSSLILTCWILLAGILMLALTIPEAVPEPGHRDAAPLFEILRQPRVQALFAACFAMSAAHGALYVFYSIHLADHAYSKTEVGALWSLGVVAEIIVFMVMVRVEQTYSLRTILMACFIAAIGRFLLIGWTIDIPALTILAQVLHGLTFGAYHAAAIAAVNQWFPGNSQARGQAIYSSVSFGAGGLVGGMISGWTWDWLGAAWTYSFSSIFALAGLVMIACWVRDLPVGKEHRS
ncbi:MAG: MFS transporter [Betaproteobacteria bacterium]